MDVVAAAPFDAATARRELQFAERSAGQLVRRARHREAELEALVRDVTASMTETVRLVESVGRGPVLWLASDADARRLAARLTRLTGRQAALSIRLDRLIRREARSGRRTPGAAQLHAATARLLACNVRVVRGTAAGVAATDLARRTGAWRAVAPVSFLACGLAGVFAAGSGPLVVGGAMAAALVLSAVAGRALWPD